MAVALSSAITEFGIMAEGQGLQRLFGLRGEGPSGEARPPER